MTTGVALFLSQAPPDDALGRLADAVPAAVA
jgi:hypothetical protein